MAGSISIDDLLLLKAMTGQRQDPANLESIKRRPELQIDWDSVKVCQTS